MTDEELATAFAAHAPAEDEAFVRAVVARIEEEEETRAAWARGALIAAAITCAVFAAPAFGGVSVAVIAAAVAVGSWTWAEAT